MKIFSAAQIREWDAFTIREEPVRSIDLMERAATECFSWIVQHFDDSFNFVIFCGKGNNGGDGLALARLLNSIKYSVSVVIPVNDSEGSPDFATNLKKLERTSVAIKEVADAASLPHLTRDHVIIDALFGTGLNKPVTGWYAEVIHFINQTGCNVISIDVPSGLFIDQSSVENDHQAIITADFTLTFQNQKLAFLMPENGPFVGQVTLLDIGLSEAFEEKENSRLTFTDEAVIDRLYRARKDFSHKGNYGHAGLLCGSYGMMGAAVLSAAACLRSGVGKLTCVSCEAGYDILQTSVPEAMCHTSGEKYIKGIKDVSGFDTLGIGPGIGKHDSHRSLLEAVFSIKKPVVIDADGLNALSAHRDLYEKIPENSILTPHPKEFERLFGQVHNDFERVQLALKKARELRVHLVCKSHYTFIASPDGAGYFNSTGNSGMATAGAGDVLTGILTGLLAQGYQPLDSCVLGVYLHGLAGDLAAEAISKEAMVAGDITQYLGQAFRQVAAN